MDLIMLGGLVLGLTQVVKKTFNLQTLRFIPLIAIVIALLVVLVFCFLSNLAVSWQFVQNALVAGLTSVGLWEVGTKTLNQ